MRGKPGEGSKGGSEGAAAASAALRTPLAELPDPLPIVPLTGQPRPFHTLVRPPGSKSLTNRAMLLAALAGGESVLIHPLRDADDARRMRAAVQQLGACVAESRDALRIEGVGGLWNAVGPVTLDLGNAGTAMRFLAAACVLAEPDSPGIILDGNERMRERPIGELVGMLRQLGAQIDEVGAPGRPPIRVHPLRASESTPVLEIPSTLSSQYISALLLIGPFLPRGLVLHFTEPVTSVSYVEMTVGLMRRLGIAVDGCANDRRRAFDAGVNAPHGGLRVHPAEFDCDRAPIPNLLAPFELEIEPDASGATYFWAAAALFPGASCLVPGLGSDSLQGDAKFVEVLREMGAHVESLEPHDAPPAVRVTGPARLRAIEVDLSRMPDAAMTLAALAVFADGTTTIRGLRTLRVKETDRLEALRAELGKVGAQVRIIRDGSDEGLEIKPASASSWEPDSAPPPAVEFDTYDDHRMAMALALIGLRRANVLIRDPGCVAKTYPGYWRDLSRLYEA